jgi:hypothetical protein
MSLLGEYLKGSAYIWSSNLKHPASGLLPGYLDLETSCLSQEDKKTFLGYLDDFSGSKEAVD